jgi:hypothetical protein
MAFKKLGKKIEKIVSKNFYPKNFFLARRHPDTIESDPVVRKKKFQQIWKAQKTIKTQKMLFLIRVIIDDAVHSRKKSIYFGNSLLLIT